MYDQNGLELSPISERAKTAYKNTAANERARTFSAIANANGAKFRMRTIKRYKDDRDAAFVGQEFAKLYDEHAVGQMIRDCTFDEVVGEFLAGLEIPEWQFPSEGMTFDEMAGDETYEKNRVENMELALKEALKMFLPDECPLPKLFKAQQMWHAANELYAGGMSRREAAKTVVIQHVKDWMAKQFARAA